MATFRFILTHPSGERRHVSIAADSVDEAAAILEDRELRKVGYQLTPERLAELDEKLKVGALSGADKAALLTHQQETPYKIGKARES
jgi:hypothetical protein